MTGKCIFITFYCGEDEEGDDGIVQTTGRLGNAGQDGERVQQVAVTKEREQESAVTLTAELSAKMTTSQSWQEFKVTICNLMCWPALNTPREVCVFVSGTYNMATLRGM